MKRSWLLTAAAALSLAGGIAAAAPAAAAPAATVRPDLPVVTICLTYARAWCADVKNDRNVSGQPIWLYKASAAKAYHFYDVDVNCPSTGVPGCAEFVDVKNPAMCIAVRNNRNVVLLGCNAYAAEWVIVAKGSHYVHWANGPEYLTVSAPVAGRQLSINYKHGGGWQQWTGP
jgi:hypothetical protein